MSHLDKKNETLLLISKHCDFSLSNFLRFTMKSTLTLFFVWISIVYGRKLNLHLFENAVEKELICNDGSPSGYYIDYASLSSNKWLIFQQGGGWCYNEDSCWTRIGQPLESGDHGSLISSKSWNNEITEGGLFDLVDDFNVVKIPYCSRYKLSLFKSWPVLLSLFF